LPVFLALHIVESSGAELPVDAGNHKSIPYRIVAWAGTDPYILPNESGGNPLQANFQRIKYPVIEWKFTVKEFNETVRKSQTEPFKEETPLKLNDILNTCCILRL